MKKGVIIMKNKQVFDVIKGKTDRGRQDEQQNSDDAQQSASDEVQQEEISDNQSGEEDQADEPEQKPADSDKLEKQDDKKDEPADDRPTKEEAKDMTAEELKVDNSDDPTYPVGKEQSLLEFTYFGGIYRDCWLVAHNDIFITNANYEKETGNFG